MERSGQVHVHSRLQNRQNRYRNRAECNTTRNNISKRGTRTTPTVRGLIACDDIKTFLRYILPRPEYKKDAPFRARLLSRGIYTADSHMYLPPRRQLDRIIVATCSWCTSLAGAIDEARWLLVCVHVLWGVDTRLSVSTTAYLLFYVRVYFWILSDRNAISSSTYQIVKTHNA